MSRPVQANWLERILRYSTPMRGNHFRTSGGDFILFHLFILRPAVAFEAELWYSKRVLLPGPVERARHWDESY